MTPAAMKGAAKRTLDNVVKWTYAYGMRPRATKTKFMMVLDGDKSRITAAALAKEGFTCVLRPFSEEPGEFVKAQAPLGARVTPAAQGPEMRRRTSSAIASRGPLRKEIFPKPQIPQCEKVLYNDALTNSRLLCNCHVRNILADGESTGIEVECMGAADLSRWPRDEGPRWSTRT